jgi:hypothetical protein
MMSCTARPPSPPVVGERRLDPAVRAEPSGPRTPDADAFQRILQRKSRDDEDGCDERGDDGGDTPPPPPTPDAPAPAPLLRAAPSVLAPPLLAHVELPAAIVAAAHRAALNGEAPASMATALRGDTPAAAWEVSVQESPGVRVELRATRDAVPAAAQAPAPWTLTVGSAALNRAALVRHASRLEERLRTRGVAPGHVRIQDAEDERS